VEEPPRPLNLRPLKAWVKERFPSGDSIFREVILGEDDFLSPQAFVTKLKTWLSVLNWEVEKWRKS
jgi:hypothetical protein